MVGTSVSPVDTRSRSGPDSPSPPARELHGICQDIEVMRWSYARTLEHRGPAVCPGGRRDAILQRGRTPRSRRVGVSPLINPTPTATMCGTVSTLPSLARNTYRFEACVTKVLSYPANRSGISRPPRCSPFVRQPLILLIKMPGIPFIAVGYPPQNCCCSRPTYRNPFRHPTILLRHVAFLIATIIDATKRYTALIITSNFQTGFNI